MITIVSATNRENSFTYKVANIYFTCLNNLNVESQIFDFRDLPDDFLFSSSYGRKNKKFDLLVNKYLIGIDKYIFICPEYNGSIPGVLKSFIDCCDYKLYKSKKIGLVGISDGHAGNLRGLDHLTSIFHHLNSEIHSSKPKLSHISKGFNKKGDLINEKYLQLINDHINSFSNF